MLMETTGLNQTNNISEKLTVAPTAAAPQQPGKRSGGCSFPLFGTLNHPFRCYR